MRVTLDVDEKYTGVLSITAIASNDKGKTSVAVAGVDITRFNHISVDNTGHFTQEEEHAE